MASPENSTQLLSPHAALLKRNDREAERNRALFHSKGLLVLNVLSSPGSGKTKLLERTLSDMGARLRLGVIVGDLQTDNDARRLSGRGAPVVPITTGTVCHLESAMVSRAAEQLDLDALDVLVIENVGNLVCPARFDLGEDFRIVLFSTTEGEDKPLKYPSIFFKSELLVLTKIDLLPYVPFDVTTAIENARRVHPEMEIVKVSCLTGNGLHDWLNWLERRKLAFRTDLAETLA